MDTSRLKKFAQFARRSLIEQVQTKLKLVLAEDSLARRESPKAVKELENKKQELGEEQLLEQVAYTWFNRFCALRFMDANQYNRIMVVSPVAGQFQPEILAEAKAGHLDDSIFNGKARDEINGLLSGAIPSRDGQSEAYRLMIVAVCNDYHRLMPYLFERIEDYTELLMPDDLLSGNSILAYTREAMTPENCESVESIGWLYQFYISEKKDQVFEGLKKNKKITPENIPAATQLFTPHWIVRYLVENSLGRLWMLNNPSSKVIEQMDYYIKPVEEERDYLKISSPEGLKICDPACGSGHMLTYAYDLLYAIYLDAGYESSEIPEKILTNNLFGIEIDERAAELAAFALSMKALKGNPLDESNNRRRFFRNPIEPNICHIQNVSFSEVELDEYFEFVGVDIFTKDLRATLKEFEEADNFGSLIQPTLKNPADVLAMLNSKDVSGQLFLADTHKSVLKALKQADYLSQKYQVVIANPPYMGGKGMNASLTKFAKCNYPDSKSDLFAMFIERAIHLGVDCSSIAMINMQSWMFLSTYVKLRNKIISNSAISSLIQIGYNTFPELNSKVAQGAAFVLQKSKEENPGYYYNLNNAPQSADKELVFINQLAESHDYCYRTSFSELVKVPGAPIAYWLSEQVRDSFSGLNLNGYSKPLIGMRTGDNERFIRMWHEVSQSKVSGNSLNSKPKWFPYSKGGEFRRWYGNNEYFVNWEDNGFEIKENTIKNYPQLDWDNLGWKISNESKYFRKSITWTCVSTSPFAARVTDEGSIFDTGGSFIPFKDNVDNISLLGYLNSNVSQKFLELLNPTINYGNGTVGKLPWKNVTAKVENINELVEISRSDWNASELSWDFERLAIFCSENFNSKLSLSFDNLKDSWRKAIYKVKELEEENNLTYIEAFGLSEELTNEVDLKAVTLNCNPYFKYSDNKADAQLEKLQLIDFCCDLISYAVGCIFGRYSLDQGGLVLASQGDSLKEYFNQIPEPIFYPDKDNAVPFIDFDGDWFEDDIAERFKLFLKVAFGEEYFSENLKFIEASIGKDIKKYFSKDFYMDHIKRYKKRPIYWMFSSPKGTFNVLIYMHRYTKDTVDVVLNNYLREFRTKLLARKESLDQIEVSASASQRDKTQAIKTIAKINEVLGEIDDYEYDVLYPLAGEKVEIDLDDGVKHNYPLFGKALKKVPGLS
ncbi:TPA: BREX-1 system adenine-specific DNA-methyltransferase PglX [Photobacterium damselae]